MGARVVCLFMLCLSIYPSSHLSGYFSLSMHLSPSPNSLTSLPELHSNQSAFHSQKSGARMKCSACKIIAHTGCIAALVEKVKFLCKPTFRDVGPRQYREQTATHHHWVHRRNQKGKCKQCGKVSVARAT